MRKLLTALTLALLLSLVLIGAVGIGVAGATHSEGEGPEDDFMRGTMKDSGVDPSAPSVTFEQIHHVNAKSGPAGEDPQGRFFIKSRASDPANRFNFEASGPVICLSVQGNRARYVGEIERGTESFGSTPLRGSYFVIDVVDNGEPGDNDGFLGAALIPNRPRICPPVRPRVIPPGEQGNYVVHDGQPNSTGVSATEAPEESEDLGTEPFPGAE